MVSPQNKWRKRTGWVKGITSAEKNKPNAALIVVRGQPPALTTGREATPRDISTGPSDGLEKITRRRGLGANFSL